jgi:hypothetical protein
MGFAQPAKTGVNALMLLNPSYATQYDSMLNAPIRWRAPA